LEFEARFKPLEFTSIMWSLAIGENKVSSWRHPLFHPFPAMEMCVLAAFVFPAPAFHFPMEAAAAGKPATEGDMWRDETHILTWKDNNLQRRGASKSNRPARNKLGKEGFREKKN
jgi:hypothetical protein